MNNDYGRYDNIENLGPSYFDGNNFDREYNSQNYRNPVNGMTQQATMNPYQQHTPYMPNNQYSYQNQSQYTQNQINEIKSHLVFISPDSFSSVQHAIDALKQNQTVIINFQKVKNDILERILDYMSGAVYAMSGSMQRMSQYLFAFTPKDVKIKIPMEVVEAFKGNK